MSTTSGPGSGGILAVPGLGAAHRTLGDTGCTVLVCPTGALAAVDVRGGGPGTRETDLLAPENTVQRIHGLALSGGSAYGLAVADGVMRELERAGIGFAVLGPDTPGPIVPIVPAAVIFDLLVGDSSHRPAAGDGAIATKAALATAAANPWVSAAATTAPLQPELFAFDPRAALPTGSYGAGAAATAGRVRGGFGQASCTIDTAAGTFTVAAGVVANPVGQILDPDTGVIYAAPTRRVDPVAFKALPCLDSKLNTTIGAIVTDAPLPPAQLKRLAMCAHDGLARAVRPAHSPLDGDTFFALSTYPQDPGSGVAPQVLGELSQAAADLCCTAILDAVLGAADQPGPAGNYEPGRRALRSLLQ